MNPCVCWNLRDGTFAIAIWTIMSSVVEIGLQAWQTVVISGCQDQLPNVVSALNPCDWIANQCPCTMTMPYSRLQAIMNALFGVQILNIIVLVWLLLGSFALIYGLKANAHLFLWVWMPPAVMSVFTLTSYAVVWWAGQADNYWIGMTVIALIVALINAYCCICVWAMYGELRNAQQQFDLKFREKKRKPHYNNYHDPWEDKSNEEVHHIHYGNQNHYVNGYGYKQLESSNPADAEFTCACCQYNPAEKQYPGSGWIDMNETVACPICRAHYRKTDLPNGITIVPQPPSYTDPMFPGNPGSSNVSPVLPINEHPIPEIPVVEIIPSKQKPELDMQPDEIPFVSEHEVLITPRRDRRENQRGPKYSPPKHRWQYPSDLDDYDKQRRRIQKERRRSEHYRRDVDSDDDYPARRKSSRNDRYDRDRDRDKDRFDDRSQRRRDKNDRRHSRGENDLRSHRSHSESDVRGQSRRQKRNRDKERDNRSARRRNSDESYHSESSEVESYRNKTDTPRRHKRPGSTHGTPTKSRPRRRSYGSNPDLLEEDTEMKKMVKKPRSILDTINNSKGNNANVPMNGITIPHHIIIPSNPTDDPNRPRNYQVTSEITINYPKNRNGANGIGSGETSKSVYV